MSASMSPCVVRLRVASMDNGNIREVPPEAEKMLR